MAAPALAGIQQGQQPFPDQGQFSTFAPSKEDIMGALEFFFGKPAQPDKIHDFANHHQLTEHLPDIYNGSNVHLKETINNLILMSPENWQTTAALPFLQVDGVTVSWDSIHFDVRVMQRVPYEGASRMQTSIRRQHRDRIVRRGIALLVESDFYRTPEGRQYFSDQVKSIQYCVQVTCNYDVLYAYLSCHDYDFNWDLTKNLLPQRNVLQAMRKEIMNYAIVQKQGRGLDLAIEQAKQRMARYGVRPNMMVTVPETQLYLNMVPHEKIVYNEAGPKGPEMFESYRGNDPMASYRGLSIYTSNPFDSGDNIDSVQMLRRSTQVGEFYIMKPPTVFTAKLPGTYMDLLLYNEQADRIAHISFRNAVMHAMPWMLDDAECIKKMKEKWDEGDAYTKRSIDLVTAGGGDIAAPTGSFGSYEWWKNCITFVESGGYAPVMIVIARPFIEHEMFSSIITVAGRATGATLFGPADMQIAANATVKVIEGHYTYVATLLEPFSPVSAHSTLTHMRYDPLRRCHTKAVITEPKNVMVMRDIQCAAYKCGSDVTWFGDIELDGSTGTKPAFVKLAMDDGLAQAAKLAAAVKQDIQDRLNFEREFDSRYGSMLAFAAPFDTSALETNLAFSLGRTLLPWDINSRTDAQRSFPGGTLFYEKYAKLFGLDTIQDGMDPNSMSKQDFVRNGTVNNVLCFLGPHRVFSALTGTQIDLVAGQGHFGPDAQPGDARWRRGEAVDVTTARSELAGLEVAQAAASARFALQSGV